MATPKLKEDEASDLRMKVSSIIRQARAPPPRIYQDSPIENDKKDPKIP